MDKLIAKYFQQIKLPAPNSHKGLNGKLLIIGGSELFHAASKWSLDIASKFVDMVFYSSVPENNELIREAKGEFWNGIVIERDNLTSYLEEADTILIGPGMERTSESGKWKVESRSLSVDEWNNDTEKIVNYLLNKYPAKKWVIDAGALQMVEPKLLNKNCIITPHAKELERLLQKHEVRNQKHEINLKPEISNLKLKFSDLEFVSDFEIRISDLISKGITILLKGPLDYVISSQGVIEISGGNAGMTKGGTGDVLAGLVAALYTTHDAMTSSVVGSYINKKAGENLFKRVGPYFNASDLVTEIPQIFWQELQSL